MIMKTARFQHRLLRLSVLLGIALSSHSAHADFLLKPNDRVVFLGDSITEFRNYTRPFQDYVYSRYPERHIRFFNAGWSDDTAGGGLNRLNRDVLSLNPTVVTICFGMNDGGYTKLTDDILNNYRTNLDGIVKALTDKNVRVIVFSPPPVDYDRRAALKDAEYNKTLEAMGQAGSEIAKKYGATYVDIIHPILNTQAALKAKTPVFTFIPDAVHPDETGGTVMAGAMLQGMGAEPMPALAEIGVVQLTGPDKDEFDFPQPTRVPLWMSADSAAAAQQLGFLGVAGQKLQVKGLKSGTYEVKISGNTLGSWSNTELGAGVNVPGTYSTRARQLVDLTNAKEQNYFNLWRSLKLGAESSPAVEGAVAGSMRADDAFQSAIESLVTPISGGKLTVEFTLPTDIGPNLALNKPYEVSDPNGYNWGIGGLTDGSWEASSGHTFASGDKDAFPKTATIDLGKIAPICYVSLGVPPFGSTKTVQVSVSADGQNFTEVGSAAFAQQKEAKHLYAFAATPARYVRLTYPDHYTEAAGFSPNFSFTTEVEVYSSIK